MTERTMPIRINLMNGTHRDFTPADLGEATSSGPYWLISYLEQPIPIGTRVDYVVFVTDNSDVDEYRWRVEQLDDSGLPLGGDDGLLDEDDTDEGVYWFRPDAGGRIRVTVEIMVDGQVAGTLTLVQAVEPRDAAIERLLLGRGVGDYVRSEIGSLAGETQTTRELANDLKRFILQAADATGANGIPWQFLSAVVYKETLHRPKELVVYRPYLPDVALVSGGDAVRSWELEFAAEDLNDTSFLPSFRTHLNNSLGVCQIQPQTAAMLLQMTERRQKASGLTDDEEINDQVWAAFEDLPDDQRIGVYNLVRFPKTNIRLCAELLAYLKNRTTPERFANQNTSVFLADKRAQTIVATEYNLGATLTPGPDAKPSKYGNKVAAFVDSPFLPLLNPAAKLDLDALLTYLGMEYGPFAPSESAYFAALTMHLRRHGAIGATATVDAATFRNAVRTFQVANGLGNDGIPGQDTLWTLQEDWAPTAQLAFTSVPADQWVRPPVTIANINACLHGFNFFEMRADMTGRYRELRAEALAAGAIVTSANSKRVIDVNDDPCLTPAQIAEVAASRSPISMHYPGIALDLSTATGMVDPATDPYIIEEDPDNPDYWRVWAATDLQVGQQLRLGDGALPSNRAGIERRLRGVVHDRADPGTTSVDEVTRRVIDFTALASRHGFHRISKRDSFPDTYFSAEWWHFQCEDLLIPGISQFGIELLRSYSQADLEAQPAIWNRRKRIFKRGGAATGWH
jgi:hypothetical protein